MLVLASMHRTAPSSPARGRISSRIGPAAAYTVPRIGDDGTSSINVTYPCISSTIRIRNVYIFHQRASNTGPLLR